MDRRVRMSYVRFELRILYPFASEPGKAKTTKQMINEEKKSESSGLSGLRLMAGVRREVTIPIFQLGSGMEVQFSLFSHPTSTSFSTGHSSGRTKERRSFTTYSKKRSIGG